MRKLEKTKNAKRNLIAGIINKLVMLFLPFALRTLMIYLLGIEYVGINSLFASVLSVLSLAELGFGSAVVYSMYKPIAENDSETICALMNYYKRCYRIIGTVIFAVGIIIMPFIHLLVKKDLPDDINIYVVYSISLFSTGISYFLFGYKNCLLNAHQRSDVSSNIGTVMIFIRYGLEISLLLLLHNYYIYMLIALIINMSNNIVTAIVVDKIWPQYKAKGKLSAELRKTIGKKVRGLFVYKIGNIVINSADTIVISSFLGLRILGQYQNYYYIITSLFGFFSIFYSSIAAGIGNAMVTETKERVYKMFDGLLLLQAIITGWCSVCLINLFQPFIELWAGEENLLSVTIMILITVYFYQWKMQDIVHVFKEAGGMWDRDKFRPLIAAMTNLTLNVILVNYIGLSGVLLSTIIAGVCVDMPWACRILYRGYFERSEKNYYVKMALYLLITIAACVVTWLIGGLIVVDSWITLILRALVCGVVGAVLLLVIYSRFSGFEFIKEKVGSIVKVKK